MKWYLGAGIFLVIAWLTGLSLLAYSMYALLAVLIVSRWLASQWSQQITSERRCDRLTANVGETVTVVAQIQNQGRFSIAWLLLEDLLPPEALLYNPPSLELSGRRIQLIRLKSGQSETMLYQLTCNRRGYYQIGPLALETGDLFGLHRRFRLLNEPSFLLVYPRVIPVEDYQLASRRPIGEIRMTYRLFEDPTRIAGVRTYQAGDSLNRVNWRATARTGELQSKVYEPSSVAGGTVLLDFHRNSYAPKNEPYRSELAITAAASVANAISLLGQQVGLISNGRDAADRIREEGWRRDARTRQAARAAASMTSQSERLRPVVVPTRRGEEQMTRILESLARLELTDGFELPHLVNESADRLPRDATVIAIVSTVTPEIATSLGMLRRQGYAVSVLVNVFEESAYADECGMLMAEGLESHHLKSEETISFICRGLQLR